MIWYNALIQLFFMFISFMGVLEGEILRRILRKEIKNLPKNENGDQVKLLYNGVLIGESLSVLWVLYILGDFIYPVQERAEILNYLQMVLTSFLLVSVPTGVIYALKRLLFRKKKEVELVK